jgi:hypothetical protein
MNVEMDPDMIKVISFMQSNIPVSKLVPIARGISDLSGSLWGHHSGERINALALVPSPISDYDPHTQSAAT